MSRPHEVSRWVVAGMPYSGSSRMAEVYLVSSDETSFLNSTMSSLVGSLYLPSIFFMAPRWPMARAAMTPSAFMVRSRRVRFAAESS